MKRALVAVGLLLSSGMAFCSEGAAWGYSGAKGPENWARLSPEYGACAGSNQSPINLSGFIDARLEPIVFAYNAGSAEILNNGHTFR